MFFSVDKKKVEERKTSDNFTSEILNQISFSLVVIAIYVPNCINQSASLIDRQKLVQTED